MKSEPKLTIGLSLRNLEIAKKLSEETKMANDWNIYVLKNDKEILIESMKHSAEHITDDCVLVLRPKAL
jgi:hypothetical protein